MAVVNRDFAMFVIARGMGFVDFSDSCEPATDKVCAMSMKYFEISSGNIFKCYRSIFACRFSWIFQTISRYNNFLGIGQEFFVPGT